MADMPSIPNARTVPYIVEDRSIVKSTHSLISVSVSLPSADGDVNSCFYV